MKICFDIDNVLADSDPVIRRIINEYTENRVNLERNDIIEFNYCECRDRNGESLTKSEWSKVHSIFSSPDNIDSIQLLPGVQEGIKLLSAQYEIHFATSRLPEAKSATLWWLEKFGLNAYKTHFLEPGKKHEVLSDCELMVEDHYEQAAAFAMNGTKCYLFEYPWNVMKPAIPKLIWVKGWKGLIASLL